MWPGHQINIRGQHIIFPPPKPYNLKVCTPPLPTCMHHQRFQNFPKNPLFSRKCCFCCFCCFLGVANVEFQNFQNQEMLLHIFIFFIRRLEKKIFHFEVMFLKGGQFSDLLQFLPKNRASRMSRGVEELVPRSKKHF